MDVWPVAMQPDACGWGGGAGERTLTSWARMEGRQSGRLASGHAACLRVGARTLTSWARMEGWRVTMRWMLRRATYWISGSALSSVTRGGAIFLHSALVVASWTALYCCALRTSSWRRMTCTAAHPAAHNAQHAQRCSVAERRELHPQLAQDDLAPSACVASGVQDGAIGQAVQHMFLAAAEDSSAHTGWQMAPVCCLA